MPAYNLYGGLSATPAYNYGFPATPVLHFGSSAPPAYNIPATTPDPAPDVPVPPAMTTTAAPPTPPNWKASCNDVVKALKPVMQFPVASSTKEYQVLEELVTSSDGLKVSRIERVVNPTLWNKFETVRKDLLCSKSNDMELLSSLDLSDTELHQQAHVALNSNPAAGIPTYADNVAILFHCTTKGNVGNVLSRGLDERIVNAGTLGRGIYFSGKYN